MDGLFYCFRFIAQARNNGEAWRTSTPASAGHTPLPCEVPNNGTRRASDPVRRDEQSGTQVC